MRLTVVMLLVTVLAMVAMRGVARRRTFGT